MTANAKIAVVIPAYNEEQTIGQVIVDMHQELPDAEIYVIDNRSTDHTHQIAVETMARLGCPGAVLSEKRPGKATAIRTAFLNIDADAYVMIDADLTYHASDVHDLLAPILAGEADMVVGDRLSSGAYASANRRRFHEFGNAMVRDLINLLFGGKLHDIMSGYRAFNRLFVDHLPILTRGFELETEITLHALNYKFRITEIPVKYHDRPAGSESKLNTFIDGGRIINRILWVFKDYKPLIFFGCLSVLTFLAALVTWLACRPGISQANLSLAAGPSIFVLGLFIIAVLLAAIGLILDTIAKHHRFSFELMLHRAKPAYHQNAS